VGADHEEQDSEGAEHQGRQERDQKVTPVKGTSTNPVGHQHRKRIQKRVNGNCLGDFLLVVGEFHKVGALLIMDSLFMPSRTCIIGSSNYQKETDRHIPEGRMETLQEYVGVQVLAIVLILSPPCTM